MASISMGQAVKVVRYLFVDGGCLREALNRASAKYFDNNTIEIDYRVLADGFKKVFYYDCLPPQKLDEDSLEYEARIKPNIDFFNGLRLLDRYHVYQGIIQRRGRRGPEQKQVDIMIAVDMLTHSFGKNMEEATLLTSDLDFKPLIDALVRNGMYITLWYPERTTNKELVFAADAKRPLNIQSIYNMCTDSFRQKYTIPRALATYKDDIGNYTSVESITNTSNVELKLYEYNGIYTYVFPEFSNQNSFIHVYYNNIVVLKAFLNEIYEIGV